MQPVFMTSITDVFEIQPPFVHADLSANLLKSADIERVSWFYVGDHGTYGITFRREEVKGLWRESHVDNLDDNELKIEDIQAWFSDCQTKILPQPDYQVNYYNDER